jgi:hypothetical protein
MSRVLGEKKAQQSLRLLDQLVNPPGGVPHDQSSKSWSSEFLIGGVEKNFIVYPVFPKHK